MDTQAKILHDQLEQIGGCGDGSCIVHVRPGMHTNGGCRCNRESQKMSAVIYWHKRAVAEQAQQIERLREALTPSSATKAAYIGDFSFSMEVPDEDGCPVAVRVVVPWTSIKDIMSAIRTRAALQPKEGE